ncbi:MAG: hypothetical protein ACR2LS_11215 [Thermomicrobiales bacterium]
MRLVVREQHGEQERAVSAAVVHSDHAGGIVLEVGPADGPPHMRLILTTREAHRLSAALRTIGTNGGEQILLTES